MNPGLLNKRVSFLEQPDQQNTYGEENGGWVEQFTVWAYVKPLRGKELYQAKQVQSETEFKITIRYKEGITSDMRVKYGTKTLEIIAPPINVDERNRYLEIMCKEVI